MACSSKITVLGIEQASVQKGINLVGTGDLTHPEWLKELKENLEPAEPGLYKVKGSPGGTRFILSGEVSTVFNKDGKQRRIHHLMLLPSFEAAYAVNERLSKHGDLMSDGRPQLSMSAAELVEEIFNSEADAFVLPAHAWTPYFGVFGALTGFDSMKEAYEDQEKHIHALESGLSSDPAMNWRLSMIDKYSIISNSDMHSLDKLGREANIFDVESGKLSYKSITGAMKEKGSGVLKSTIEFYPEEGKYHYDGHRQCGFSVDPEKSQLKKCPVCARSLVIGVLHRINDLADRPPGFVPKGAVPFVKLVPLREVIANATRKGVYSVAVGRTYSDLISSIGTELDILMNANDEDIAAIAGPEISQAIANMRNGNITIKPGYAGVFGEIDLLNRTKREDGTAGQRSLFTSGNK